MTSRKLSVVSASMFALVLLAVATSAPFASAARPANLHIDWTIILKGSPINGQMPTGNSDYEVQNTFRRFEADCDQVNVPDGTQLDVMVNGRYVGSFRTLDQGGALVLTGSRAPQVSKGTKVSINFHNGPAILSGSY